MRMLISAFVVVQLVCLAFTKDLPSNFKKCKRSDANLDECLKGAIQEALGLLSNGLPAFKIPVMEPLRIEKMTIGEGTGAVKVVQNYKDVDIYNITKVTLTHVNSKISDTDLLIEFDLTHPTITFKANYNLNGNILVLPIVGEGPCTLELDDVKAKLTVIGKAEERKGLNYMKVHEIKVSLNPKKVIFNFENLFNGDQQLGAAMNKVLNENDLLVYSDVQNGYEEFLAIVIKDIANKIFEHVPFKDLLPE